MSPRVSVVALVVLAALVPAWWALVLHHEGWAETFQTPGVSLDTWWPADVLLVVAAVVSAVLVAKASPARVAWLGVSTGGWAFGALVCLSRAAPTGEGVPATLLMTAGCLVSAAIASVECRRP